MHDLDRLDVDAVGRAHRAAAPRRRRPDLRPALLGETEGVPLLVVEYLRALERRRRRVGLPAGARDAAARPARPGERDGAADPVGGGRARPVVRRRDGACGASGRTDEETVAALEELSGTAWSASAASTTTSATRSCAPGLRRDQPRAPTAAARAGRRAGRAPAAAARHLSSPAREAAAPPRARWAAEQARAVFANAEAAGHLRAALALGHRTAPSAARRDRRPADVRATTPVRSPATSAAAAAAPDRLGRSSTGSARLHHRRGEWALAEAHLDGRPRGDAADEPATGRGSPPTSAWPARRRRRRPRRLAGPARRRWPSGRRPRAPAPGHNLLGLLAPAARRLETRARPPATSLRARRAARRRRLRGRRAEQPGAGAPRRRRPRRGGRADPSRARAVRGARRPAPRGRPAQQPGRPAARARSTTTRRWSTSRRRWRSSPRSAPRRSRGRRSGSSSAGERRSELRPRTAVEVVALNPDPLDQEPRRQRQFIGAVARPAAADGEVQQQVHVVVERPGATGHVGTVQRGVTGAVERPGDPVRLPVDRVVVEAVGEVDSGIVRRADPGRRRARRSSPAWPGMCTVPWTVDGREPTCSITSISPHAGHPTSAMSVPSIQNAGQVPSPPGTRIRASTRPYRRWTAPSVTRRAEVIAPRGASQAPRPPRDGR